MPQKTIKTLARQAQEELIDESNNSSLLLQPFATKAYQMTSARLATTLEEINILSNTQAIVRTGFEQDDQQKTITIPTIFAQIDGLPKDSKKYWQHLDAIRDSKGLQALVARHLNASDWNIDPQDFDVLMANLTPDTLQKSPAWTYHILNQQLQQKMANSIIDLFTDWPFTIDKTPQNQQFVLSVLLDLPQELLEMNLEVDYPKEVPLLAFIHQQSLGEVTDEDVIALTLFHYLGWDVIVYSPHAFASLENYLLKDTFDHFSYETVRETTFAQGDQKPSLFKKIFG